MNPVRRLPFAALAALLMLPLCFCSRADAAAPPEEEQTGAADAYYEAAWNTLDEGTAAMLADFGVNAAGMDSLFRLSPDGILQALLRLFRASAAEIRSGFFSALLLLILSGVFLSFADRGQNREFAGVVSAAAVMFSLIVGAAQIADRCVTAVTLTAELVKGLLPVYAGVIAFSGNPGAAAQMYTLAFAYAQGAGAWFARCAPPFAAAGVSLAAAGALQPQPGFSALPALLQKGVRFVMGGVAAVFSAVLSVRCLLAGAGDTVAVKGARFLIGSAVPVVGSAVGDALSSVGAGLALARTGVGMLGVLAVALVNLPALSALLLWQAALFVLGAAAEWFGDLRTSRFIETLRGFFGTLAAALVFNAVVYIVALGLVLRAKGGG